MLVSLVVSDWDDSQTDLVHLGGATPGSAKSGGDKLWEDDWDDDDVEDEFNVQLRYVPVSSKSRRSTWKMFELLCASEHIFERYARRQGA